MSAIKKIIQFLGGLLFFYRKKEIDSKKVHNVLVVSLYFRGDLLFHTPVIKILNYLIPGAKIDFWVKSRSSELIEYNPRIRKVLVFDDLKTADYNEKSYLNLPGKLKFLRKLRKEKYDLIIDLTGKYSTAIFTLLSGSRYSIGINYNGFGFLYSKFIDLNTSHSKGHLIDKYLNVIKEGFSVTNEEWKVIIEKVKPKPELYIPQKIKEEIDKIFIELGIDSEKPLVVIHTTAGWNAKELNTKVFSNLLNYLKQGSKYYLLIVGSEWDEEKVRAIYRDLDKNLFPDVKSFFRPLSMLASSEVIRRSDVFVGSDSFPLHTTGAFDVPSVGLFGPTNPDFSNPIGDQHLVVYYKLYCSASDSEQFCTRNAGKTCATIDCMKLITVSEIAAKVELLVAGHYGRGKHQN